MIESPVTAFSSQTGVRSSQAFPAMVTTFSVLRSSAMTSRSPVASLTNATSPPSGEIEGSEALPGTSKILERSLPTSPTTSESSPLVVVTPT